MTCPNCGGGIDGDSRFCKHCAFDLSTRANVAESTVVNARPQKKPKSNRLYALAAVGVAAILVLGVVGGFLYKRYRAQAIAATPSPSPTGPVVSERAKQIEAKILHGDVLNESDLAGLSPYELRVLRNVHFARYGRKYDQGGELGSYFYTRSWYKPSDTYNDNLINATDKANVNLIVTVERSVQAQTVTANSSTPQALISSTPSSTPVQADSKYQLSRDQMREMLLRRGFFDPFWGWQHLDRVEILKVGDFKEKEKYWPVQAKGFQGNKYYILDYQIFINDYGEWEVRMGKAIWT